MFMGIASSVHWTSVEPVNKGWSTDRKYRILTDRGESLLLRVSDFERIEAKKREYGIIRKFSLCGFELSRPIEFGVCNDRKNCYMLLSWVEGRDLETVLPQLSEAEQYRLGRAAGTILRSIHSISLDEKEIPNATKREKKLLQLSRYEASSVRINGDETAIRYVKDHIGEIWKKQPVYQHGDFHPGNLIYTDSGTLGVIDFNRWEVGDPYEEFYKLESFGVESSVPYCIGQIDAYFDDAIPHDFWIANAVYVAHASLYSIKWAEQFGQNDVNGMVKRARRAFDDFDGFRALIPKWYTDAYRKNRAD